MLFGTLADSIMCRYFCTGFIDFIFKDESLLAYTNLLSLNEKRYNNNINNNTNSNNNNNINNNNNNNNKNNNKID